MNKQQKIKKLAWKYFWAQKRKEIFRHLKEHEFIYTFLSLVFGIVFLHFGFSGEYGNPMWAKILGVFFFGIPTLIFFKDITIKISKWIESNWEEAYERAEEEIK